MEAKKKFIYDEIVPRIIKGDLSALVEIYKEDLSKEFNGLEEEIKNQEEKIQGTKKLDGE